jgi:hypothetical protein
MMNSTDVFHEVGHPYDVTSHAHAFASRVGMLLWFTSEHAAEQRLQLWYASHQTSIIRREGCCVFMLLCTMNRDPHLRDHFIMMSRPRLVGTCSYERIVATKPSITPREALLQTSFSNFANFNCILDNSSLFQYQPPSFTYQDASRRRSPSIWRVPGRPKQALLW